MPITWIDRLKQKWKLNSAMQVVIVLIVFACTGFTVLFIKKPILAFLIGGNGNNNWVASVLYYLFILPLYNLILLGYGFVFGQFKFFWEFEKRFINRVMSIFKTTK